MKTKTALTEEFSEVEKLNSPLQPLSFLMELTNALHLKSTS